MAAMQKLKKSSQECKRAVPIGRVDLPSHERGAATDKGLSETRLP